MVAGREWVRDTQISSLGPASGTTIYDTSTIGFVTAPDATSKLRRIIIDISFSLIVDDTTGSGVAPDWWQYEQPMFASGRDQDPGSGDLSITGFGDERVTITGALPLIRAGVSTGPTAQHSAQWGTRVSSDSHGQRDPFPGAGLTVAPLTVQVSGLVVVDSSIIWAAWWQAYMRVLWDTPA